MERVMTAIAASVATLLATHAFAGKEEMAGRQPVSDSLPDAVVLDTGHCAPKAAVLPMAEQSAFIKSCLGEASSSANVKAAALRQKKAYCDKNVKNKALQDGEKESYFTACMNHNEAQVQYEQVNREMAATDTGASMNSRNPLERFLGFVTGFWRAGIGGAR